MSGEIQTYLFLILAGLVAGFIDSIAGGGGLIGLPSMILVLGPGVRAIGTNKVASTTAALVALLVYLKRGHVDWAKALSFTAWIALGAFSGSRAAPYVPAELFPVLLMITCPLILWIVWRKDLWIKKDDLDQKHVTWLKITDPAIILSGYLCGFYDGVWGPGGGTFMFLSLLFIAKLPLITALATAKFANTTSAATSLLSYAAGNYVEWIPGSVLALGIGVGAFIGARYASQKAARVIRPTLVVVVLLLMIRLITSSR